MLEQVTNTFMDLIVGYQQEVEPSSASTEQPTETAHMDLGCTIPEFYTKIIDMLAGYYLGGVSWSQKEWVSARAVFTRRQWELAIKTLRSRNIIHGKGHGKMVYETYEDANRAFWLANIQHYVTTQQGLLGI